MEVPSGCNITQSTHAYIIVCVSEINNINFSQKSHYTGIRFFTDRFNIQSINMINILFAIFNSIYTTKIITLTF